MTAHDEDQPMGAAGAVALVIRISHAHARQNKAAILLAQEWATGAVSPETGARFIAATDLLEQAKAALADYAKATEPIRQQMDEMLDAIPHARPHLRVVD